MTKSLTDFPPGVIFLPPGSGRKYSMGPMRSVFKADGPETDDRYCISEWWVDPHQPGSGPHLHEANEEIFYVIEGTMTFRVGEDWIDAPRGSFLRIPAGVVHDFENRTDSPAGIVNIYTPGGFEAEFMPKIMAWFESQSRNSDEP